VLLLPLLLPPLLRVPPPMRSVERDGVSPAAETGPETVVNHYP